MGRGGGSGSGSGRGGGEGVLESEGGRGVGGLHALHQQHLAMTIVTMTVMVMTMVTVKATGCVRVYVSMLVWCVLSCRTPSVVLVSTGARASQWGYARSRGCGVMLWCGVWCHLLHLLPRPHGACGEGRQLTPQQARRVDKGYLQTRSNRRAGGRRGGGVVAVV